VSYESFCKLRATEEILRVVCEAFHAT
jgi:hypothetical protein